MTRALRTVEEIFGEPLPPLTSEQQAQLEQTLVTQIETLYRGGYQWVKLGSGERNRAIARRCLLDGAKMKDVAPEFGITTGRVGQLRLKALRMLRHPSRSRPLKVIFKPPQEEQIDE